MAVLTWTLPITLLSSCADSTGDKANGAPPTNVEQQTSSTHTTTPAPTRVNTPASDARLLSALLGPTSPKCVRGAMRTDVRCGQLVAGLAQLAGYVDKALQGMPKTAAHQKVSEAVATFQRAHENAQSLGCYTPNPTKGATDELCRHVADLVMLSWLGLNAAIDQLGTAR